MAPAHHTITFADANKPRRMAVTKYLERRIIRAWKSLTRKPQRASVLMEDFVILNARRRSVMCY